MLPDGWTVEVWGPDGKKTIHLSAEQVEYFMGGGMKDSYATAAYLAYCDLWTQG